MRSSPTCSSGNISKKLNPIKRRMKLKDYIKEVRNHILAYDYACVVALADHIVEDYKEYIKETFQNNVQTEDTARQVWDRLEYPSCIEPFVNQ